MTSRMVDNPRAQSMIRVLCVDDVPDVAAVMQMVIDAEPDMACVGTLHSADNLSATVRDLAADGPLVLVLDATMPGTDPVEVMTELAATLPDVKTIICSAHDDRKFIDHMKAAGAWGCVSKQDPPKAIVQAVRDVAVGTSAFQPGSQPTPFETRR